MGKPLSVKHLAFCEAIVAGKSASAAYGLAYPDASKQTCRQEGMVLSYHPDVVAFFDTLKSERVTKAALTRDEWLEKMLSLASKAEKAGDVSNAIKALREYGLAVDTYAPSKVEVSGESSLHVSLAATLAAIRG